MIDEAGNANLLPSSLKVGIDRISGHLYPVSVRLSGFFITGIRPDVGSELT